MPIFRNPPHLPWGGRRTPAVELPTPTVVAASANAAAPVFALASATATIVSVVAAHANAAALVFSAGSPTATIRSVIPSAAWLSGLNGDFFIESIQLDWQPGKAPLTVTYQLFDRDQATV